MFKVCLTWNDFPFHIYKRQNLVLDVIMQLPVLSPFLDNACFDRLKRNAPFQAASFLLFYLSA